ncbi:MAG: DUF5071 domain-containing protein [Lachnospiraceae bacterium]|nr:DUF5071 domain-containing protein [Lachnospiraceae bacterium]
MFRIDELLRISEYDIYNNPNVSDERIREIAEIISTDKSIDLNEYFDLLKCSSKFCWLNYLKILGKLPEEDKIRGISLLFVLLQDENWPTFQKTMKLLKKFDKKIIAPFFDKYLEQAYAEDDEMWISNMQSLAKKLK